MKTLEQYKPTKEEMKKSEEMMTEKEKEESLTRESEYAKKNTRKI